MSGQDELARTFREMRAEFRRQKVAFAVVGGLAVSVRSRPRFTQDIDVAVGVSSDSEAEAVVRGFANQGFRVLSQIEQTATGRLATVRLQRPKTPIVDLLSRDPRTRQQDDLDVSALLLELSPSDIDKVTDALRLITQRGFHRRRRLLATWKRLRPHRST